jgi:glycosyltransferase involved in cell wall biosynthesis
MSRPRRIAFVTPLYFPVGGGVESHVEQLAQRLAARGDEVEVLTQTADPSLPERETREGVTVRRFQIPLRSQHYAWAPSLGRHLTAHGDDYDLIHSHNYHALPALAAARRTRRPLIFTPHYHGTSESAFRRALHRPYRRVARRMIGRAARVICVSPAEAKLLSRHFPTVADKLRVIPNGVDAAAIAAAEPFPTERRVVLSAGRLEDYKRVDALISALPHLDSRFEVRITGDGPALRRLEEKARAQGSEDRVRFLGRVEREELNRWFRTASVYVTMSRIEAMPVTPLEVLHAGAHVVASDIPAHRNIATLAPEAVHLVAADTDGAELARSIERAAEQGPAHADVLSWDAVLDETETVYDEALEGRVAALA